MKLALKIILEIVSWGLLIGFMVMMVLTAMSNSSILGKYRSFLVQSGSMEPSIMTGDIIIIKSSPQYLKNDVVTFDDHQQRRVTHRIIDIKEDGHFVTKGDANKSSDSENILKNQILGKVFLVIPKLGYLVAFSKSFMGFLIFIIIPGILIVAGESIKIKNNVKTW